MLPRDLCFKMRGKTCIAIYLSITGRPKFFGVCVGALFLVEFKALDYSQVIANNVDSLLCPYLGQSLTVSASYALAGGTGARYGCIAAY